MINENTYKLPDPVPPGPFTAHREGLYRPIQGAYSPIPKGEKPNGAR